MLRNVGIEYILAVEPAYTSTKKSDYRSPPACVPKFLYNPKILYLSMSSYSVHVRVRTNTSLSVSNLFKSTNIIPILYPAYFDLQYALTLKKTLKQINLCMANSFFLRHEHF
jgi:hypothetical protein